MTRHFIVVLVVLVCLPSLITSLTIKTNEKNDLPNAPSPSPNINQSILNSKHTQFTPNSPNEHLHKNEHPHTKNKELAKRIRTLLFNLQHKLHAKGVNVKFIEKALEDDAPLTLKRAERLIQQAKRNIAKRVHKVASEARKRKSKEIKSRARIQSAKLGISLHSSAQSQRNGIRGRLNSCPGNQRRIYSVCRCPYLSNWDTERNTCMCTYGTYMDTQGNCHSYFA